MEVFINYNKIYNSIITRARLRGNCSMSKRNRLAGHEKHHVLPVCTGGKNSSDNLVFVTSREHFICHILLVKFSKPEHLKSLQYALGMMQSRGKIVSSHSYKFAREQYRLAHIQTRTGTKHTAETKRKISEAHRGKKRSPEHCEATRVAQLGKKLSEEHKKKLSNATKGRSISYQLTSKQLSPKLKITCPYCLLTGGKPVMMRYHFKNCKLKV